MIQVVSVVLLFLGLASTPKAAWAQSTNFKSEMSKWAEACFDGICGSPYGQKTIYRFSEQNLIDPTLKNKLDDISFIQAQIWGDTILEGDYVSDGLVRVDRIYEIFKNKKLIAYRVTYSERAWYTGDCRYDGIHKDTLADCTPGRIAETSYVSTDFKEYFYDEYSAAKFK